MDGWFKMFRSITDWEWFNDGNTLKLWIYLLAKANYKDSHYMGIKIKRGQLVTGRKKLADALRMSEQQIRTCLDRLEKSKNVTIKSTNRYSLITIVKYDFYQEGGDDCNQQNNQQITNKQPTNNHNLRNKESKKERNIYNSLPVYDPSENKIMTSEEENELLELMKGEA